MRTRLRGWLGCPKLRVLAGLVLIQLMLLYLYYGVETHDLAHLEFYQTVRDVGVWGILLSFVYKEIVVGLMLLTTDKTPLDRRWIWQTQAMAMLMLYAFVAFEYPGPLVAHPVENSVIWFNIWAHILWSAGEVLWYLWKERGRWAWAYLRLLVASWGAGPHWFRRTRNTT